MNLEDKSILVGESHVDYTGRTCAKIGLSSTTLIKHRGRCSPHNHCLSNQIPDLVNIASLSLVAPSMKIGGDQPRRTLIRDNIAASSIQITIPAAGQCGRA